MEDPLVQKGKGKNERKHPAAGPRRKKQIGVPRFTQRLHIQKPILTDLISDG